MLHAKDRCRSLEDLDGERWGDPPLGTTRLVAEVHRLRRRPLGDLSVEDLRLLIGQGIALQRLVPLALERLRTDPLAEGDLYRGDLLSAVLRSGVEFWSRNPALADELTEIVDGLTDGPAEVAAEVARFRRREA